MDMPTVEKLLTTTRSVRKRLDFSRPVPLDVIERCLDISLQAPTGGNGQQWKFMVITDPDKRKGVAEYYAKSFQLYAAASAAEAPKLEADDPRSQRKMKVISSAVYLSQKMADVPVLIIALYQGRVENESAMVQAGFYGSILPAAWSLMLALRAEGIGSAWTTLHLRYEKEVAALLGIPDDYTQTVLLPAAYFTGQDFLPAKRVPARDLTYHDTWGQKLDG